VFCRNTLVDKVYLHFIIPKQRKKLHKEAVYRPDICNKLDVIDSRCI